MTIIYLMQYSLGTVKASLNAAGTFTIISRGLLALFHWMHLIVDSFVIALFIWLPTSETYRFYVSRMKDSPAIPVEHRRFHRQK